MSDPSDIEKWAWAQDIQFGAKIVLVCLSRYAHWATLECWPSQATVAGKCGMSERTVRSQLGALEASGLITRTKRLTAQGRQTDMTVLLIPGWGQPANYVATNRKQLPGKLLRELLRKNTGARTAYLPTRNPPKLVTIPASHSSLRGRPHTHAPAE